MIDIRPMTEYIFINEIQQLDQLEITPEDKRICGIDTETTGLDPRLDRLRLLQIAVSGQATYVIDCFEVLPLGLSRIQEYLDSFHVKIFQNAKFDINFLLANGLVIHGQLFDTMLAGLLLRTSGGPKRVGLADLTKHYLGIELSKDQQKSDFSASLSEEQLQYGAKDAGVLLKLRGFWFKNLRLIS